MSAPDLRCLDCGGEFVSADHPELHACPTCGAESIPANPQNDRDWTLTEWEWRLLVTATLIWCYLQPENSGMLRCVNRLWWRIMGYEVEKPISLGTAASLPDDYIRVCEETVEKTVRCDPHELRVLTMWASWAVQAGVEGAAPISDADLEPILTKLRRQQEKPFPLTFEDEISEIREHFPETTVEVHYASGEERAA